MNNCIVSKNGLFANASKLYENGGALYNQDGSAFFENCTVAYNSEEAIYNSDGIVTAHNSILYFNSGPPILGSATVNYCDIEGGWTTGDGNIDVDPKFVAAPIDFRLKSTSPCLDMGDPDPYYYDDTTFPPSQGTVINDMGYTGGPFAPGWPSLPDVDIKANGDDGPVYTATGIPVEITVNLEPGQEEGTEADWWFCVFAPPGTSWLNPSLNWVHSFVPVSVAKKGLYRIDGQIIFKRNLPPGVYRFFFILDATPNAVFDNLTWTDAVIVIVS